MGTKRKYLHCPTPLVKDKNSPPNDAVREYDIRGACIVQCAVFLRILFRVILELGDQIADFSPERLGVFAAVAAIVFATFGWSLTVHGRSAGTAVASISRSAAS